MLKVLVCDDHQLCREGLTQVVSKLEDEVEVTPAGTYPEVLAAIAADGTIDLILVERSLLPMADGSGMADVVRRAGNTPVVVLSALDSRDDIAHARTAGAAGFLFKSSPVAQIQDALRTVLDGDTCFPDFPNDVPAATQGADAPSDADRARIDLLTNRQRDVLALVGEGRSNKDIAEALGISEGTVKVHVGAILKALGTSNRTQAALIAIDFGIAALPHDTNRARHA
jgi:DNA-binding NarL/FixJ family response regulator